MRVYCINLDRSTLRLAHMQRIFAAEGLSFTRFAAVDGGQISGVARGLTKGELGCLLSHRAVWQEIATSGAPFAAIFEDDIHISHRLAAFLNGISVLPSGADILKLETMNYPVTLDKKPVAEIANVRLKRLRSAHLGSAGYVVSKACATRLLGMTAGLASEIDSIAARGGAEEVAAAGYFKRRWRGMKFRLKLLRQGLQHGAVKFKK